jgi:hypothetical protein
MSEQLNLATFTGAHPSTGQLVEQLHAWGFRQLRVEGVHLVFRGPHGGTLRVLRSMLGRADAAATAKAARLAEVDEPTFWAGPEAHARNLAQPTDAGTDATDSALRALLDDDAAARGSREADPRSDHRGGPGGARRDGSTTWVQPGRGTGRRVVDPQPGQRCQ